MSIYEIVADDWTSLDEEALINIEELVNAKLAPLPGSATRILGILQDEDVSTRSLAEVIGYDPVLTSRVMRLANSSMYAMRREVSTVSAAIAAIGVSSIYDIVMLGVAADSFSKEFRSMKTGVSLWEHSVSVAIASREISRELGLRGTEEAFTCGLLHDIGKNLLFQADSLRFPETEYAEDSDGASLIEKRIFGYTHSQVGFYVARQWGLSDGVSSVLLSHHDPSQAAHAVVISHIVNVADDLVTRKGMGMHVGSPDTYPSSMSVNSLSLSETQMENVWIKTETSTNEILERC